VEKLAVDVPGGRGDGCSKVIGDRKPQTRKFPAIPMTGREGSPSSLATCSHSGSMHRAKSEADCPLRHSRTKLRSLRPRLGWGERTVMAVVLPLPSMHRLPCDSAHGEALA